MKLQSISKIASHFNISTRTLRYYEQIGLIRPQRNQGSTYRLYDGESSYKYQVWASVPDGMDVHKPLVKRTFIGGLYAAHMIRSGDFDHWSLLRDWVIRSDKYQNDWCTVRCSPMENDMDRCLEEILNYRGLLQNSQLGVNHIQFDLLFPIKERQ